MLYLEQMSIFLLTFSTTSDSLCNNPFFRSQYRVRARSSCLKVTELRDDNDNTLESIDRAPCFDGVCNSDPEPNVLLRLGEATSRLGGPATGPTVWSEFGRFASANPNIANLGQGFPDWLPPKFALDSLVEAVMDVAQSPHQYTRTAGHPNLVKELAKRYSIHLRRDVDSMAEVAVTVGASQALYLSLQTLIRPGDEVILFEPFFDLYVNQVKLAGGTPVYVPLTFDNSVTTGQWILEAEKLHKAVTPNTRAIILNSPHNPTGKVFTRREMETIADILANVASPSCVVISDEVYKYIIHSPPKEEESQSELRQGRITHGNGHSHKEAIACPGHVHFASLPGMWDRTITISSAGKTFSATGWQVGWCIGPKTLISSIHQLIPYVQFCASTVIQEALARALPRADLPYEGFTNYYEYLKDKYTRKRDALALALKRAGFTVPDYEYVPGGGFFIFARIGEEISNALPKERINVPNAAAPGGIARKDWALCQWLAEERGVLCIPASPFFSKERAVEGASDDFVRIAFCKTDETIEAAASAFMSLQKVHQAHAPPLSNAAEVNNTDTDKEKSKAAALELLDERV